MRILRAALPLLLGLTACVGLPDRWSVATGAGEGELDRIETGKRDFESQWVEVGVSGPLGSAKETRMSPMPPITIQQPSAPTAQPEQSDGIPWMELALLLGGAAGMKGSEYGYRRVRERKSRQT